MHSYSCKQMRSAIEKILNYLGLLEEFGRNPEFAVRIQGFRRCARISRALTAAQSYRLSPISSQLCRDPAHRDRRGIRSI